MSGYLFVGGHVDGKRIAFQENNTMCMQFAVPVLAGPSTLWDPSLGPSDALPIKREVYRRSTWHSGNGKIHALFVHEDLTESQVFEKLLENYNPKKEQP